MGSTAAVHVLLAVFFAGYVRIAMLIEASPDTYPAWIGGPDRAVLPSPPP